MNAKRTIQAIFFGGIVLATAVAGCATSVSDGPGVGSSAATCEGLFSQGGGACLGGCNGAQSACAASGQSAAFDAFLMCIANAGAQCSGGTAQISASCSTQAAAIAACGNGMTNPNPTSTTTGTSPNPTSTGTTPPPSDAGAKDTGSNPPPSDSGDPCTNCANAAQNPGGQCASDVTTCTNDPACNTLLNCLNACTNTACENSCATTAGATATNELSAIDTCICSTACPSQCASSCSSPPTDAGPPPPTDSGSGDAGGACNTCADAAQNPGGQCYSEVTACMNDNACVSLVNCLNACAPNDMNCVNTCASSATMGAINEYNNLGNCICTTACMSQCTGQGC